MNQTDQSPISDAELEHLFAPLEAHSRLAVGVSGGADSMALMHLLVRWRDRRVDADTELIVMTVDHGLRAESRAEAEWVAEQARLAGLKHFILEWRGEKPRSGLQEAAREARYGLMIEAAKGEKCTALVVAHHAQDQAETLLMRLARGSGIDGLAGMAPVVERCGIQLHRPLLGLSKMRLRASLEAEGKTWLEDPSNDNPAFERIRVRDVLKAIEPLGIDPSSLARSAQRLTRARQALEEDAHSAVAACVDCHGGAYAGIEIAEFFLRSEEIRLRILGAVIAAFGGRRRLPQMAKLEVALRGLDRAFDIKTAYSTSLGGALVRFEGGDFRIFREPLRGDICEMPITPGAAPVSWDGRFEISASADAPTGLSVSALGEQGLRDIDELGWRAVDMPREALLALPGIRLDGEIIVPPQLMELANLSGNGPEMAPDYVVQMRFLAARMCQRDTES